MIMSMPLFNLSSSTVARNLIFLSLLSLSSTVKGSKVIMLHYGIAAVNFLFLFVYPPFLILYCYFLRC